MDWTEFQKSFTAPPPAYLLIADQDYFKGKVYELCQGQVEESARLFDWSVFDLAADPVSELMNVAKTLPWMATRRWVYVKNADSGVEKLDEYLVKPSPRTVLVLELKRRPRGWSSLPTIKMPERKNLVSWIVERVRKEGYEIEGRAAEAMAELVGEDYQQLTAELEKQFLCELETRKINLNSVLEMTLQVRQFDVFALINAIAVRDVSTAIHVLECLLNSGMTVSQIVSMLYWNFRRLLVAREMLDQGHPFRSILAKLKIWSYRGREEEIRGYSYEFLEEILILLCETDRLFKTTVTDSESYLVRVIVDTCGGESL